MANPNPDVVAPNVSNHPPPLTLTQVVARANASPYGLAAGVFGHRLGMVNQLVRSLRAGTVWVNSYNLYDNAVSASDLCER